MRDSSPTLQIIAAIVALAIAAVLSAKAQDLNRTDIAASIYGAFNGTTEGNGTVQSPSNQAGGRIELRHISNPLIGYEGQYCENLYHAPDLLKAASSTRTFART